MVAKEGYNSNIFRRAELQFNELNVLDASTNPTALDSTFSYISFVACKAINFTATTLTSTQLKTA